MVSWLMTRLWKFTWWFGRVFTPSSAHAEKNWSNNAVKHSKHRIGPSMRIYSKKLMLKRGTSLSSTLNLLIQVFKTLQWIISSSASKEPYLTLKLRRTCKSLKLVSVENGSAKKLLRTNQETSWKESTSNSLRKCATLILDYRRFPKKIAWQKLLNCKAG